MNEPTKQNPPKGHATAAKATPKKAAPQVVHRITSADVIKAKDATATPLHAAKDDHAPKQRK